MHAPASTDLLPPEPTTAARTTAVVDARLPAVPLLVDARWLIDHADDVIVIDTRSVREFSGAHVPGSRSIPLDGLLLDDSSRPVIDELARTVQRTLATAGITPGDHVVLVDDGDGSAPLGAALFQLAGMSRVSVVGGSGMSQLVVEGCELVATDQHDDVVDVDDSWASTPIRFDGIAAFEDIVDAVVDGTARIVDARSQLEHEGIVGAPCCGGRGAIPGSVHVEWTSCFDMFGRPADAARIRSVFEQVGIMPSDHVIVSCHAGHRAAISALALRAAGFEHVRVSLGSWHEWSLRGLVDD